LDVNSILTRIRAGKLRDWLLKDTVYITGCKYCGHQKYLELVDSVF